MRAWYCSELVEAAYLRVGIDVAVYNFADNPNFHSLIYCFPVDLYNSYNTSTVPVSSNFLQLTCLGKARWNIWRIRVKNNLSIPVTCEYNRKMCFDGEASWWDTKKLKDLRNVYIPANSSVEVEVQENWCATSITFSHWRNNRRYITYADNLTTNYGGGHLRQIL